MVIPYLVILGKQSTASTTQSKKLLTRNQKVSAVPPRTVLLRTQHWLRLKIGIEKLERSTADSPDARVVAVCYVIYHLMSLLIILISSEPQNYKKHNNSHSLLTQSNTHNNRQT